MKPQICQMDIWLQRFFCVCATKKVWKYLLAQKNGRRGVTGAIKIRKMQNIIKTKCISERAVTTALETHLPCQHTDGICALSCGVKQTRG